MQKFSLEEVDVRFAFNRELRLHFQNVNRESRCDLDDYLKRGREARASLSGCLPVFKSRTIKGRSPWISLKGCGRFFRVNTIFCLLFLLNQQILIKMKKKIEIDSKKTKSLFMDPFESKKKKLIMKSLFLLFDY